MKDDKIISINTTKAIQSRLDQIVACHEIGLPKTVFSDFKSILEDEKNLINWREEQSHSFYEGFVLEGGVLRKLPPFQAPALPQAIEDLKIYKRKLEDGLTPLEQAKNKKEQLELFEKQVLMLISFYPTYCKKDEKFQKGKTLDFLMFFEKYPIAIFVQVVNEWIKSEREFPLVCDLISRIEAKIFKAEKKLNCLEKIISKSTSN